MTKREKIEAWIDKWSDSYDWRAAVRGNPTEVEILLSELRALDDSYERQDTDQQLNEDDWETVRRILETYLQQ